MKTCSDRMFLAAVVVAVLLCAGMPLIAADSPQEVNRRARQAFLESDLDTARQLWDQLDTSALIDDDRPTDAGLILFNRAACHVESQEYDQAISLYQQALPLIKPGDLRAQCQYNLGNVYLSQARTAASEDLEQAIVLARRAGNTLRQALRYNPDDADYRHNLSLARQLLGELLAVKEQQQQQQEQQQQEQENLADKIKELLERQERLQQKTGVLGEQRAEDPNYPTFVGDMLDNAAQQQQLAADTQALDQQLQMQLSQPQPDPTAAQGQAMPQEVPPEHRELLQGVSEELIGSIMDQTVAVGELQALSDTEGFAAQARSAEHLRNALKLLQQNQQQQQGQSQQDQQGDSEQQEGQDPSDQQSQGQQQGNRQSGEDRNQTQQTDMQEPDEVDPSEQAVQRILEAEEQRRERMQMQIKKKNRGKVDKDW